MKKTRILYVEDEAKLAELIRDYLLAADYDVTVMHTGAGVIEQIRSDPPDLALLDLMLPVVDGLTLCREIREFTDLPIIMITAKVEEIDRLLGLEIGADDYICKPAKPREVVARVKALLRRIAMASNNTLGSRLQLDEERHVVMLDGQKLDVTRVEFRLLSLLAKRPGWVYSRSQLMQAIYDNDRDTSDRAIDSHIKNLRRKMAGCTQNDDLIQSVYGVGYKLALEGM